MAAADDGGRRLREAMAEAPPDLAEALRAGGAASAFARLPPSHRREYLEWIGEAKRPATRERRIRSTVERLLAD